MSNLPTLGRLGIQLNTRVLSGLITTGYRTVDPTAEFLSGTVAKLTTVNGVTVATPVTSKSDAAVGVFWSDKASTFYRSVYKEKVLLGADGVAVNLQHANLKSGTVLVYDQDGTTEVVAAANYTVVLTNGTIAPIAAGAIAGDPFCYVSYWYADPTKTGLDNCYGDKVAMIEGTGEFATTVYDTAVTFTLGAGVYFTDGGVLTISNGGTKIGTVTKVPTSDDAELYVKVTL